MDLPKKINKFAEDYSKENWLRVAVSGIPIVGSSLDTFLSTQGQKIIQGRIEKLIENLGNELSNIREDQVKKEYITSEEFFDLIRIALEKASRTRQIEKIFLYSKILIGVIVATEKTDLAERAITLISDLSLTDIDVAKIMYEQQRGIDERTYEGYEGEDNENINELKFVTDRGWKKLPELTGHSWEELTFIFSNLERVGLIREVTGTYAGYLGGVYRITHVFNELMNLIENKT